MIVLLNCSMSLLANDNANPLTGRLESKQDSTLIAYDDLKLVNSKLIELEYEKDINERYRKIIANDSIIIKNYTDLNNSLNKDCKKAIKQRNIGIGIGIVGISIAILAFIFR